MFFETLMCRFERPALAVWRGYGDSADFSRFGEEPPQTGALGVPACGDHSGLCRPYRIGATVVRFVEASHFISANSPAGITPSERPFR